MNSSEGSNEKKEEKLEFLKREEIRTMQKDIAKLRELESQKERERIASLKPDATKARQEKRREEVIIPPAPSPVKGEEIPAKAPAPEVPQTLIPKPPKRPAPIQKIAVRAAIIAGLVLVIGFFYWLLAVKKGGEGKEEITPPAVTEEETPTTTATTTPEMPEIAIPTITDRIVSWGYYIPTATRTIDTIIILSAASPTEDPYSADGVIQESKKYKVSPHYLIDREGVIYRLVPDEYVAYHAGAGQMPDGSRKNIINFFSIGIELVYPQSDSPNDAQYQSLRELIVYLKQRYNISRANILGHNEINPSKTDPWNFDWQKINE